MNKATEWFRRTVQSNLQKQAVEVGDRVQYSQAWLQSAGMYTGPIPFARGVVMELVPFGGGALAVVDWGDPEIPGKVNVNNLEKAAARKQAMPNPVDLGVKVGDIFDAMWGYDQTNVDFYEVVGLTGASVRLRELAQTRTRGGNWGTGTVVPIPGQYISEPFLKRIQTGWQGKPGFEIRYGWASLWDGTPQGFTDYASKTAAGSSWDEAANCPLCGDYGDYADEDGAPIVKSPGAISPPLSWGGKLVCPSDGTVWQYRTYEEREEAVRQFNDIHYSKRRKASRKTASRPIYEIAADIKKEWGGKVNYAAVPYLDAMMYLDTIRDRYGMDDARMVVAYFLSNASSFRGEKAKALKAELKALSSKSGSKTAYGPPEAEWPDVADSEKSYKSGWVKMKNLGDAKGTWVYDPDGAAALLRLMEADRAVAQDFAQDLQGFGSSRKTAKEWTPKEAWDLVGNQHTDHLKMMQRALNMMQMMNTPEENERLDAVNYILKGKVKNPRYSRKAGVDPLARKTAGVVVKVMYLDGRNEASTFDTEEEADAFIEGLEDYMLVSTRESKLALNEQSGHAESDLDDVEVDDEEAKRTMFPWEIGSVEDQREARRGLNVWAQNHRLSADMVEVTDEQAGESMFDEGWAEDGYGHWNEEAGIVREQERGDSDSGMSKDDYLEQMSDEDYDLDDDDGYYGSKQGASWRDFMDEHVEIIDATPRNLIDPGWPGRWLPSTTPFNEGDEFVSEYKGETREGEVFVFYTSKTAGYYDIPEGWWIISEDEGVEAWVSDNGDEAVRERDALLEAGADARIEWRDSTYRPPAPEAIDQLVDRMAPTGPISWQQGLDWAAGVPGVEGSKTASVACGDCGGPVENPRPEWGEYQVCDSCNAKGIEESKDYDPDAAWSDFLSDADERGELVNIPDGWTASKTAEWYDEVDDSDDDSDDSDDSDGGGAVEDDESTDKEVKDDSDDSEGDDEDIEKDALRAFTRIVQANMMMETR